jgi:hypothetical protein
MIYKPGTYTAEQLSIVAYHKEVEAVSKTNLDAIHRSYQHYLASKEEVSPLSGSMPKCLVEGSALHCLVLTPGEFTKEFNILPSGLNRRTREGKALYEQIIAQGKPVITSMVFTRLEAMGGAMLNHPEASILLKEGIAESSYIWVDPDTGVTCKCRPDYLRRLQILDVKTCQDASYEAFQRDIVEHRYHVQGAYFLDGVAAVLGSEVKRDFILIAVEKTPPFAVAVYRLDDEAIEMGRAIYKADLAKYAKHTQHPDMFPGYSSGVCDMVLPKWAKKTKPEIKSVGAEILI